MEEKNICPAVGAEEVRRAARILHKYRAGKAQLERRLIENEQFWKLRHWQEMDKKGSGGNSADPRPTSGWAAARTCSAPMAGRTAFVIFSSIKVLLG